MAIQHEIHVKHVIITNFCLPFFSLFSLQEKCEQMNKITVIAFHDRRH